MQPPDILSYRSSASLEFRALQMSPTFHFFDVHAWCCLYFFGIISRENPLSYLSLLSSVFHPSPPELKNVAYFSFFRCTYLVIFTCGLTSISELHTTRPIAVRPSQQCLNLFFLKLFHVQTGSRSGFSFQTSSYHCKHDFQLRFCSQCAIWHPLPVCFPFLP